MLPASRSSQRLQLSEFRTLLQQLGQEHEREIASLEQQINAYREELAGHGSKVESDFACRAPKGQKRTTMITRELVDNFDAPDNLEDATFERGGADRQTTMDLSLHEIHEELSTVAQMSELFLNTWFGRKIGLSPEKVEEWARWWTELREPQRQGNYGLRDFVDGSRFQGFIMLCIFANIAFILYCTEDDIVTVQSNPEKPRSYETQQSRLPFELCFTGIYVIELTLKFYAHRCFFLLGQNWSWNVFDTVLVALAVSDTIMTIVELQDGGHQPKMNFLRALRIAKVSKVMRVIRAVRWVQELRLMLDCVINSVLQLFWCVSLILLVLVIFSLILVQGMTNTMADAHYESQEKYDNMQNLIRDTFDSMPRAMLSLFMATTGGQDWGDFYDVIDVCGMFYGMVFLFYIAFFCIVAWNIVMSTFVEKAFKLAVPDVEIMMLEKRRKDLRYSKELSEIIKKRVDENQSGKLTLAEFKRHFGDRELQDWFDARDIDMKDAELFFHMLASVNKEQTVDVNTFVMGCMRLRGHASNIDVQALHYDVRIMHSKQYSYIAHLNSKFERLSEQFFASLSTLQRPQISL